MANVKQIHTWNDAARYAIESDHTIVYDVAANMGQMVDNIRETRVLRDAVLEDLQESFETPSDAIAFMANSQEVK